MTGSVWIPGDQLLPDHPGVVPGRRMVLLESRSRLRQQPYPARKLVRILAALRYAAACLVHTLDWNVLLEHRLT